jgi:hypothetical protein
MMSHERPLQTCLTASEARGAVVRIGSCPSQLRAASARRPKIRGRPRLLSNSSTTVPGGRLREPGHEPPALPHAPRLADPIARAEGAGEVGLAPLRAIADVLQALMPSIAAITRQGGRVVARLEQLHEQLSRLGQRDRPLDGRWLPVVLNGGEQNLRLARECIVLPCIGQALGEFVILAGPLLGLTNFGLQFKVFFVEELVEPLQGLRVHPWAHNSYRDVGMRSPSAGLHAPSVVWCMPAPARSRPGSWPLPAPEMS